MEDVMRDECNTRMDKTNKSLYDEFMSLRSGRASLQMLDKILVDYYGTATPIPQMANVSIPDAQSIVIQPWDVSSITMIEKAIQSSKLSLNPNNDGKLIRLSIPPLTEERRKDTVKLAKNIAEKARIAIRNIRRDSMEELKKSLKMHDISEDEQKRAEVTIQKLTDEHIKAIDEALKVKEAEILSV